MLKTTVLRSDSRRWMKQLKIISGFDQELDQEITVMMSGLNYVSSKFPINPP